jgi:CDP-diacylglycerol---serine O-phosphatidyltransferase
MMTTVVRRPRMRRAIVLSPNGLTLANLFCGIWAIVAASRGDYQRAGLYVVLGGIADAFDGRVARAVGAGGRFGEELDSLVDAITFGLAPSLIMYFAVLNRSGFDWAWSFVFTACAVWRLARFNVVQAGTSKRFFQGLPSPAAGITLASYYWFSQSQLYQTTNIVGWPWQEMMRAVMGVLAFLMISNVPYPVVPKLGWRSIEGWIGLIFLLGGLSILFAQKWEYFFPLAVAYVAMGPVRAFTLGVVERTPRRRRGEEDYQLEAAFEDSIPVEELDEAYEDDIEFERDDLYPPRERRARPKRAAGPRARPLTPPAASPSVRAAAPVPPGSPVEGDSGGLDGGIAGAAKRRRRRRRPRPDRPEGGPSSTPPTE